jgi:putative ABC transport system permease protein
LPVTFEARFHLLPALMAAGVGFLVSLAFTLLPLGVLRSVSPLSVIRADHSRGDVSDRRWRIRIGLGILAGLGLVATVQARRPWEGLATVAGLLAAFAALAGVARMLTWMVGRWTPPFWPFAVRQGLASLHRPGNRTLLVLTSVGLGTFLLVTLQLTRDVLLTQLFPADRLQKPNAILFDIQPDQREAVVATVRAEGFPVLDMAPIVTMRIASLKGRSADSLLAETNNPVPGWTLRREYRSTFRSNLVDSERLIAGRFVARATEAEGPVPITVESGIARDLGLGVGDAVTFDIQGVPMETRVAGLREVDWKQVRPNFFVVFPEGVLESAPAMTVLATRVPDAAASARLQRSLVARFPNVSAIDLTLVLETLDRVVTQAGYGIRFMALFTVLTGLVVMAGAILTGRWQRVREMVLLRTLGASRRQLQQALLAEYAALGVMGALTGTLLACAAAWALARFAFRTPFTVSLIILGGAVVIVTTLTVGVGLLSSRGITRQSPLEVLRSESVS